MHKSQEYICKKIECFWLIRYFIIQCAYNNSNFRVAINKAQKEEGRIVYEAYNGIYFSIRVIGNLIMANTIWVPAKGRWCSAAITNTNIEPGKH